MDAILSFAGVEKSFGGKAVLQGVDLTVGRGGICGLVGANGAGKTTMMRLALGMITQNRGEVTLNLSQKGNVGVLIDYPVLDTAMTVRQNLEAHCRLCGCASPAVRQAIELVGIQSYETKKVKQLCLGEKQKTALAQALLGNPELVILDEPVNGLDPRGVREVREIIVRMNREHGTTFLISSHIIDELVKVVTRCALLKDGKIKMVNADAAEIEQEFFGGREVF